MLGCLTAINLLIAFAGWAIRSLDRINKKLSKPTFEKIKKWCLNNWLSSTIQLISIILLLYMGPFIVENGFGVCIEEDSHFYKLYSFFVGYANYAIIRGFMGWLSSKTWFYSEKEK